ncbi:MAG: GerW family sporulation protein [Ruminococcus sp.]
MLPKPLRRLWKGLSLRHLTVGVQVGRFDAKECALAYGAANAAVYAAVGLLSSAMRVHLEQLTVQCAFGQERSRWVIRGRLHFCPLSALLALGSFAMGYVMQKTGRKMPRKNRRRKSTAPPDKQEVKMQEKKPIQDLMGITMEKMREMVDVQTIIGDPIVVSEKVTIVPVSKVSYGFASGGSDLPVKSNPKDLFGGGAGAGVSIQPVAFLVVQEDGVRLLQMDEGSDALSSAIRSVPEVVDRLGSIFKKDKKTAMRRKMLRHNRRHFA